MSQLVEQKNTEFEITYFSPKPTKIIRVSHDNFNNNLFFRRFIKSQKCLACGFECVFEDEIK